MVVIKYSVGESKGIVILKSLVRPGAVIFAASYSSRAKLSARLKR